jgi:Domain of unknown function (DUF4357)
VTRVVKLVFLDDDPAKRAFCDESNRTARVFKLPRALISQSSNRDELEQVGLYLLVGNNENEPDRPFAYVGEAENVLERLKQHHSNFQKFDWNIALLLISQDKSLNKAHVKYLEHEWYQKLISANVASVDQTIPTRSSLSESENAIADDFSKTGQFLVEALGYRLFESRSQIAIAPQSAQRVQKFVFETSKKQGNRAYGYPTTDGFLVEKGSGLDLEEKRAGLEYWGPVRKELRDQGIIGMQDGKLVFLTDWLAPSPSRAAAVAYGGSVNGLEYWRTENSGETLRSWQARNALV